MTDVGVFVETDLIDSVAFVVNMGSEVNDTWVGSRDSEGVRGSRLPSSLLQAMMVRKARIKPVEIIFSVIDLDFLKVPKIQFEQIQRNKFICLVLNE